MRREPLLRKMRRQGEGDAAEDRGGGPGLQVHRAAVEDHRPLADSHAARQPTRASLEEDYVLSNSELERFF